MTVNYAFQTRYQKNRSHLKLPPLDQINQVNKSPKTQHSSLTNKINDPMKYRVAQKYSSRLNRPPSFHPPSSQSKSAKGKYINRSLDIGSGSDSINKNSVDLQNDISLRKLHRLRQEYQQQRFEKALNNKSNQQSMPSIGNKILLPGMIHKSPYVRNFQSNIEPIELKIDRLKMLNLNQKGQAGDKIQLYN